MNRTSKISSIQEQFWLLNRLQPENPAYNIASLVRIRGDLDTGILGKALFLLVKKHPILRTSLRRKENEVFQYVRTMDEVNFHLEIKREDKPFTQDFLPEWINRQVHDPFDLEKETPVRAGLAIFPGKEFLLSLVIHHAFTDLHSKDILASDLSAFYRSLLSGDEPGVQEDHPDYAAYSEFQRGFLGSPRAEKMRAKWKEKLSGISGPLDFQQENNGNPASPGQRKFFSFDDQLTEKVKRFASENTLTPFTVLLGAWSIFLMKVAGRTSHTMGVPFSNRRDEQFRNCAGPFMNILPLDLSLTESDSFRKFLSSIRMEMLALHRMQEIPFLVLKEISDRKTAMFNTGFTFEHPFVPVLAGCECYPVVTERKGAQMDLFLTVWEDEEGFKSYLEYSEALFSRKAIERYFNVFSNLLSRLIDEHEKNIQDISLLSPQDAHFILQWNETGRTFEKDLCIHEKFTSVVKNMPDATALVWGHDQKMSYKDLNRLANRLARFLTEKGIKTEDPVAVCMPRSPEMLIAVYGILKAGGAYLPLDPNAPAERQETILKDAGADVVICFNKDSQLFPAFCEKISADNLTKGKSSDDDSEPRVGITPDNLAYIIYTSGSTGVPKGVMVEHCSVMNRLAWMQNAYPLSEEDTLLQKTPLTFDVSVWELFWWGFHGSRLALLPENAHKDPASVVDAIHRFGVTNIHFVPSMFGMFMETLKEKDAFGLLSSLQRIFLSGEALPPAMVDDFNRERRSFSLPSLINLYGPTEATVDVSYYNCPSEGKADKIYIGRPVDNVKLFITGRNRQLLPPGMTGELVITGVNLARGYRNRDELNKEKFIPLSLPEGETVKAYRTGDLARLDENGELEYLGRIDNQLKLRGLRIEPGEIESLLLKHPAVNGAIVKAELVNRQQSLVAYVVTAKNSKTEKEALKDFLSAKLPEYMIPSIYVFMDNIPLTPSGKPDRKALSSALTVNEKSIIPAESSHEKILVDLWKDLLRTDNIGVNDNFFDMGGNSLLAVSLSNRISKRFNMNISPLTVLEYPNIRAFSKFLSAAWEPGPSGEKEVSGNPGRRRARAEVSRRKRRMN